MRLTDTFFVFSYGAIGDFLMLLFFLEQVHVGKPRYAIVVLATRNTALLREMTREYPYICVTPFRISSLIALMYQSFLQRNIFVIPPTFYRVPRFLKTTAGLLCFPRGKTAGFLWRRSDVSYDIAVPFDPGKLFYKNLQQLLGALNCPEGTTPKPRLPFDESAAASFGGRPYIAIAPFAANKSRSLPSERWILLLSHLAATHLNHSIALLGGPADIDAATQLKEVSQHPRLRLFCGVPFAQTAALIKNADLYVGVDSGLTHVAGVLGTRSVVIGNLSNPTWLPRYNPYAVILTESKNCVCSGDRNKDCFYEIHGERFFRCMLDVTDEQIESAISQNLSHENI